MSNLCTTGPLPVVSVGYPGDYAGVRTVIAGLISSCRCWTGTPRVAGRLVHIGDFTSYEVWAHALRTE